MSRFFPDLHDQNFRVYSFAAQRCNSCNFQIVSYENYYWTTPATGHPASLNMIIIAISIAALLSGVLCSHESLAKCLYEEEVAEAQVSVMFCMIFYYDFYSGYPLEQGQL